MRVGSPIDAAPRRYPFLPPESQLGWTPYAWLVYLAFFFVEPLFYDVAPWEIVATGLVVAVFLPLYFWGFWQDRRRTWLAVFAIALLGAVSAPWNYGSAVFFIYAGGYLGWVGPPRRGFLGAAALVAWIAVEAWLFALPWNFWGIGIVFTVLIAGINIHYAEVGRRDRELRRSQEEVQRLARVAERERIGRDLHDLLGHTLSLITLKAELARKLLERSADPDDPATREVADIERISRRALAEVRQAVAGYRSGGLAAELERAAAALESAGLACRREVEDDALARAAAAPETERVLSFVLREAITNVLRHAEAERCRLALTVDDDVLRLEVEDDGRGGNGPEGFGLSGMRERLAAVGGSLHRDGGGGTRLAVTLPLEGDSGEGGEAGGRVADPKAPAREDIAPEAATRGETGDDRPVQAADGRASRVTAPSTASGAEG